MTNRLDKLPLLEARRLLLREASKDDAPALYEIFSREEVVRYWDHPVWTQASQADDLVKSAHEGFEKYEVFGWCITLKDSDKVIGICDLFDYSDEHKTAEIGYALHPDQWGQGLASEILPQMITFGFVSLDLNRIHAEADPRNIASLKALLAQGFKQDGLIRENWIYRGDDPSDTVVLGLLKREWNPLTI